MASSRGTGRARAVVLPVAALAATLAACDALLGIDSYTQVTCAFDCGADSGGGQPEASPQETGLPDVVVEATAEAQAEAGVEAGVDAPFDGPPFDASALAELWARWKMPNPDASIGLEASTPLPNAMAYDVADGGSPDAIDLVTRLTWNRTTIAITGGYGAAVKACTKLGAGWHVPTRIQLVSLIDFTQPDTRPMIDGKIFPKAKSAGYWTSSALPGDSGATRYWQVNFQDGSTSPTANASNVLCVKDP